MRITFNDFTNGEIPSDNSTAKQWMFVSRPCISCDFDVFRAVFESNLGLSLFFTVKKDTSVDGNTFRLKSGAFSQVTGRIPALRIAYD